MKDVQCYVLFGGIALKNHAFSFFITVTNCCLAKYMMYDICMIYDVTTHMQWMQNYAARVTLRLPNSSNITTYLKSLYWLPVWRLARIISDYGNAAADLSLMGSSG